MIEIIPTIVPDSFDDVRAGAERYAFAATVHIDAGDGRFVPNSTWQPAEGDMLPSMVKWDVHLMTESPMEVGERYARAGAARISAHVEAFAEQSAIPQALGAWRSAGAREVGLAIKIDTPLAQLASVATLCDFLPVMTIARIGTQGNPFDPRGPERVEALHAQFPSLPIAADGGINESNAADLVRAGASRLYVGSALAASADPEAVYRRLVEAASLI